METKNRPSSSLFLVPAALAALVLLTPFKIAAQTVFQDTGQGYSAAARPNRSSFEGLYGSCLLRGRPVHDFKLKDIVSGKLTTFLETARRDYTFLYYLNAGSRDSLDNLHVLETLRDRYPEQISLVAIFLDPSGERDILERLVSRKLHPDYALHDPSFHQARCYGFGGEQALHVVGPTGEIIFTVSSSRPVDLGAFYARLDHVLSMGQTGTSDFAAARDVYADAMNWLGEGRRKMALFYLERVLELQPNLYTVNCQMADICRDMKMRREAARYYSRYIGADYDAYDSDQVRQNLRSLAAMTPAGTVTE
jgi:hypothetical protein